MSQSIKSSDDKISLPAFLKLLTSTGLSMNNAMAITSKIYKTCNTPASLALITDDRLSALHINEKEHRRLILSAVKKAGFKTPSKDPAILAASAHDLAESSHKSSSPAKKASPKKRKRSEASEDVNEFLPEPPKEEKGHGEFDFKEILDEKVLITRTAVINRSPVMTAWATIVAERMGFKREEALSIASAYTEMNATSKGVSLGIFDQNKSQGLEASRDGGQPYVDFMGRRVPLYKTSEDQWRALLKGDPIPPSTAYRYITNAFRQTTRHVIGAMRLVAESYDLQELNRAAFGLYASFRPDVDGWGKKAEIKCSTILAARRNSSLSGINSTVPSFDEPPSRGLENEVEKRPISVLYENAASVDAKRPKIEIDEAEALERMVKTP